MKNKNLRFLLKCILALLPFLITMLITALFPFGYMDIEYPAWKYTKELSFKKDADSDKATLILGDSRAMADLVPDVLDDDAESDRVTYNLAVGGATPIEMYYTLKRYIDNGNTPGSVIIMFAPFHYSIIDNYITRTEYFNFLKLNEWTELIDCARAACSESVLHEGYFDDMLSCRFRFPNKYLPALVNARLFMRGNENKAGYDKITADRGHGQFGDADGCSDLNFETTYDYMHLTGDAVLVQMYMNKLLRLCTDNNIKTLVAIPPMNESSFEALNPTYVEDFTDYLNEISFLYPDIAFDKKIPHMDDKYFGDSSHLNADGAAVFSKAFKDEHTGY